MKTRYLHASLCVQISFYQRGVEYMGNSKPTLVIMAAGMGSRFKGLKQMTSVDEYGRSLMDYAIFDALEAGFGDVVFIPFEY